MQQQDYDRILAQIKRDEGAVRNAKGEHIPYRCTAGALTIGYGHNLDAVPVPLISEKSTISEDQAIRLLHHDVSVVCESLDKKFPWARHLPPARYAVLVNMAFNMGMAGLLTFKNTLTFIELGDYHNAAKNMLKSKWAGQVKDRAKRLAKQMEAGTWV